MWVLAEGRVYLLDEQARQAGLTPRERLKFHQEHSDKEMMTLFLRQPGIPYPSKRLTDL